MRHKEAPIVAGIAETAKLTATKIHDSVEASLRDSARTY
jgi:hypothetical protein